jgi:hypothetical protein
MFCNLCVPSLDLSKVFYFLRRFLEPATRLDFSYLEFFCRSISFALLIGFRSSPRSAPKLFFSPVECSASVNLGFCCRRFSSRFGTRRIRHARRPVCLESLASDRARRPHVAAEKFFFGSKRSRVAGWSSPPTRLFLCASNAPARLVSHYSDRRCLGSERARRPASRAFPSQRR